MLLHILGLLLLLIAADISEGELTTEGCGATKTCFQNPYGCSLTDPECRFISWRESDTGDTYEFEMSGSSGNGTAYIAMAFGTVDRMENADLYYCDGEKIYSALIKQYHEEPEYLTFTGGLQIKSAATIDGVAQCVLTRPVSVLKETSSGNIIDFDIRENGYWLLLATGLTKVNGIQPHTWKMVGERHHFAFSTTGGGALATHPVSLGFSALLVMFAARIVQ